jgi:hypothetical protein
MHAAAHVMSPPQLPFASHVWSVLLSGRHWRAPGEHVVQSPARQIVSQVSESCQLPLRSQVWSVLLSPGLH